MWRRGEGPVTPSLQGAGNCPFLLFWAEVEAGRYVWPMAGGGERQWVFGYNRWYTKPLLVPLDHCLQGVA